MNKQKYNCNKLISNPYKHLDKIDKMAFLKVWISLVFSLSLKAIIHYLLITLTHPKGKIYSL